jgi:predicted metal-dependent phosphoesterase TrpH
VNTPTAWINADLHCHSAVSDGTLQPEVLAARAKENGVELWALTDHDEVGGQQRARDAALAIGLPYLTGTEISVTFADTTVHIVGLGFDADDAALKAGLAATRGGRRERAMEMADGLARVGIKGSFEGALKYVKNPELISRTHFASTPRSAATRRRCSASTWSKASRVSCRTAGRRCATPSPGSRRPVAWP